MYIISSRALARFFCVFFFFCLRFCTRVTRFFRIARPRNRADWSRLGRRTRRRPFAPPPPRTIPTSASATVPARFRYRLTGIDAPPVGDVSVDKKRYDTRPKCLVDVLPDEITKCTCFVEIVVTLNRGLFFFFF